MDQNARPNKKYGPLRAKLVKQQGGRRYFDSGEFSMATMEGRAPDDLLPQDMDAAPNLIPRWKVCIDDLHRPRPYKPSRLSNMSSA